MPCHIRTLQKVLIFAALAWAGTVACPAQTSADEFKGVLLRDAAFTAEEFAALERGEVVVKLLPKTDKREVAFCGVARLQGDPATLLAAFKESLTRSGNQVIRAGGRIGTPPAPEDLQALTLEGRDLDDLKRCATGDCKLKMPAAMLERLQREVDWAAPGYSASAERVFRLMLLDYLRDYLARGDAALAEEGDKRAGGARSGERQRAPLASLPYVDDTAPEFAAYLQNFPRVELAGVENSLHWSRIKVGLKPVTVLMHTATYTRRREDAPQILVATKQLYATHYFNSSLSLTLLTSVAAAGGAPPDTYLLYANRSRADALGGLFGGIKRRLVEEATLGGLRAVLQQTKLRTEAGPADAPTSDRRADTEGAGARPRTGWLYGRARYLFLALSLVASLLLLWLRRRDLKSHST
ncbi:MAG: hypothetical protein ABW250_08725 [Pyrinomonadaceae bacterium]